MKWEKGIHCSLYLIWWAMWFPSALTRTSPRSHLHLQDLSKIIKFTLHAISCWSKIFVRNEVILSAFHLILEIFNKCFLYFSCMWNFISQYLPEIPRWTTWGDKNSKCSRCSRCVRCIHSKSWGSWGLNPADDLEFSAEKLSENATSIKITLFAELLAVISPIYVQSLQ